MKKRIISLLLIISILLTGIIPAGASFRKAEETPKTGYCLIDKIENEGFPAIESSLIFKILKAFRTITGVLTGTIFTQKNLDITADEVITDLCKYVADGTVIDINEALEEIPDIQNGLRLLTNIIPVETADIRTYLYDIKDKKLEEGDYTGAAFCHMLGVGLSVIEKAEIYGEMLEEEEGNVIQVKVDVTLKDGTVDTFDSPLYINLDTGLAYGRDDGGMLSLGFNFNVYDLVAYATIHSWQRDFGFCLGYDILCYILPFYNYRTRRFKFEYGGKEWMVQIWKGAYILANGSEVGLYNRDKGSFGTYYNCVTDEEMVNMSMTLRHNDDILVEMPEQLHWWINGFKLGKRLYHPYSLTLNFTIEMYDEEMLKAFTDSIDNQIYHDVSYTVEGLKVYCEW